MLPLLAVTAAAWTWRKSTRRCLCILPTDDVPEEIIIERRSEEEEEQDSASVAGDRDTDVELVPVHTWRSHEWNEVGQDPIQGIFRARSDYLDGYSEALADFVAMNDN